MKSFPKIFHGAAAKGCGKHPIMQQSAVTQEILLKIQKFWPLQQLVKKLLQEKNFYQKLQKFYFILSF